MILVLAIYIAIGALFAGYLGEKGGWALFAILTWPFYVVGGLVLAIMRVPYNFGRKIADLKKRKDNSC